MEAGCPMSRLRGHTRGIIQQTEVRLFDGFEADGEGIEIAIPNIAVDLERLLNPQGVLGCGL